jgi:2-methylcitrate dehydratase
VTEVEELAKFVENATFEDIKTEALEQLKIRVLDSLGCCVGALNHKVPQIIRDHVIAFGGSKDCTMISGSKTAPDRAAFYNGALLRYLDFMDSYLGVGQTCHPSDNLGSVLAAAEYAGGSGREFLTALAVAYEVQCRLIDAAPAEEIGFDHIIYLSYSAAAGVTKALGLGAAKIANAVAISGTAYQGLEVTRAGQLSNWKGLASANAGFGATHVSFLAQRGITGPVTVFEGPGGLFNAVKHRFKIRWTEIGKLDTVLKTCVKKYNVEVHAQSTIEGIMEIRHENVIDTKEINEINIRIFDRAYHVIGGGEIGGDKTIVATREQADHSLPYAVAVALLDGELTPRQYTQKRINSDDVQSLLKKVKVSPSEEKTDRYPEEMPTRIEIRMRNGEKITKEKNDYQGFPTRPMTWDDAVQKFNFLSKHNADQKLRREIISLVLHLEDAKISKLAKLLARVSGPKKSAKLTS